jgi:hypothetical protein
MGLFARLFGGVSGLGVSGLSVRRWRGLVGGGGGGVRQLGEKGLCPINIHSSNNESR